LLENTRGIFIHQVKYSESSVIATIYTEKFGRQTYMINGVHSPKASVKAAVLQPLFLLELEAYHKPGKEINRLKDAKIAVAYCSIPYDISKSSLALFLSEVLYKCLREEEANPELFGFIFHALTFLDISEKGNGNFHLWFLLKLTVYLGIFPNRENMLVSNYFDLQKAIFVSSEPTHPHFMDKHTTELFVHLFDLDFSNLHEFNLTGHDRQVLLTKFLEFYRLHFEFFGEIKSLAVFKEVFN